MLGRGSRETPVKADSPVRGWSGAESLDRVEASPTLCDVMARRVAEHDRVQPVADRVVVESNEIGSIVERLFRYFSEQPLQLEVIGRTVSCFP